MPAAMGIRRFARALAAILLGAAAVAHGQGLDALVMPGKVVEGHAKLEAQCENCHKRFDKAAQVRLCLDCHKDVASDVAGKRGYHGRAGEVADKECRACHTEHKGREARIAAFDTAKFDHAATDFALRGAHAKPGTECKSCHAAGKRWREAPPACVDCHGKDDTHKGSLGPKCADCHGERTWKEPVFDHDKTRFALLGKHENAKCKACHEKQFKDTPRDCLACHRKDDAHKARYGAKCDSCHDTRNWENHFAHDTKTKFPLGGKHRTAKCDTCHKTALYREALPTRCVSCHRADDVHKASLGEACEKCHNDRGWKSSNFDHDRDTKFALRGKHKPAKCNACHRGASREKLATDCVSCHDKDDVHNEGLGPKCATCHDEKSWKESRFDHDRDTKYALKGKHANAKCATCHAKDAYRHKAPTACIECHRKDDAHKGSLGEKCADCHAERSWKEAPFDHARSRFPLIGAHLKVTCGSCHRSARFKEAPRECAGCHEKDDVHEERLGPICEACHNTRSWASWDYDHGKRAKYPLEGAHRKAKCIACHAKPAKDKVEAPTACFSCHRGDDVHGGSFGTQCERCHGADSWKAIRAGGRVVAPRQRRTGD